MTTLLLLTTGRTDVQVVIDGVRHEFLKKRCAALHDELEQRASTWRIVDTPDQKAEAPVEVLPEHSLLLCTPKLDAVLREVVPTAALVLETRRDARSARDDPRFAGAVLEARLRQKGVETVHRRAYMQGTERLEDLEQPRDAVIRRDVVKRIEQAVCDAIAEDQPSRIVVAATGGIPKVSNLVEEIVRLHASTPVDAFEVTDGSRARPPTGDRAVARTSIPEPSVSYQARRRALELIEKGNLLGAWAVVKALHTDDVENRWTRVVKWLECFAASLPIPEDCEIPVLTHERMAVRAALRVEFALRAGDIPRAVHGTIAFFEAALWDHLAEKTSRHPNPKKRQFKFHDPPPDELVRERDQARLAELTKTSQNEDRKRPFIFKEAANGCDWYWIDDNGICAIQLARHYFRLDGLTGLGQALDGEIRELRNDVAHNEPTPERMDDARRQMREASLWSACNTFLSQPLVQNVLCELGESDPAKLCEELIATIRDRLVVPKAATRRCR